MGSSVGVKAYFENIHQVILLQVKSVGDIFTALSVQGIEEVMDYYIYKLKDDDDDIPF